MADGSIANAREPRRCKRDQSLKERRARAEDDCSSRWSARRTSRARAAESQTEAEAAASASRRWRGRESELDQLAADLTTRRSEREELAPAFDEELLELYEDLRRQKYGIGAAAIGTGYARPATRRCPQSSSTA